MGRWHRGRQIMGSRREERQSMSVNDGRVLVSDLVCVGAQLLDSRLLAEIDGLAARTYELNGGSREAKPCFPRDPRSSPDNPIPRVTYCEAPHALDRIPKEPH